jgi:hypothetical protein
MQQKEILETEIENMKEVSLSDVQREALAKAQMELDTFRAELETKKYLADVDAKGIQALAGFMKNEAPWKFTESLGIKEVQKELDACQKSGKLFMNAISYEALYFYLSKMEGKGEHVVSEAIKTLDEYLEILKSINVVRNVIANENEKLKHMEFVVASRAEGIEPEA